MKPQIAVPYHPGSNGDQDSIRMIKHYGMIPVPLYFHIGDEQKLEENANILMQTDGVVLPGGFSYQDRLADGKVAASIVQYKTALKNLRDQGKPIIGFCNGDQIAHSMNLVLPESSDYKIQMLENICDTDGKLMHEGFYNKIISTKLISNPLRTAFTREFNIGEVMPDIIAHSSGRFWADKETLKYLIENDMIVTQYCNKNGEVVDNFPTNPNGSMLNIESVTNPRGNIKIGMCHNERKISSLYENRANLVFASMREFIEDGCPDLSKNAIMKDIPLELKDYSYLSHEFDPFRTIDIYIEMLTDDNEQNTAELFLGDAVPLQRRRLLRLEVGEKHANIPSMQHIVEKLASMDFLDGIMLKKDLPTVGMKDSSVYCYEVVDRKNGKITRTFTEKNELVAGFPVRYEEVSSPNPKGYFVKKMMERNGFLREVVENVHVGSVWFFPDENAKATALEELLK